MLEQLRVAWSSNAENTAELHADADNISIKPGRVVPAPPRPTRSMRSMPVRIYGSLPRGTIEPRRNSFRDLIARLPVGGP
ncbi:hypothetical protein [Bradyrhizobium sp. CSS354]|uniref:hypothetical protein n=1 Tax=Bradyrhizobium sp. CSS354 TaxID=2699172 RepID=UPI0023AF53E5|nr:hypothetical protein [Bradyrhizobium sp. CSS354]MDE5462228.1 hypothetical protein [Bradyrhizobium sp. CSS354]